MGFIYRDLKPESEFFNPPAYVLLHLYLNESSRVHRDLRSNTYDWVCTLEHVSNHCRQIFFFISPVISCFQTLTYPNSLAQVVLLP